ncbi:MAG TPA: hypothetical protein DEO70_11340 [Bacteroidales bacterium]|nr:MAG: hypothetical protein A2X11_05430 [Bacteroidetes bacterium GWE2_42_24]OFY26543.1 MAG: hypothetical protein A2X09_03135 [Bacteroidetes bacterium GWF2_43_11]PKP27992.1 MAG: hypothetical protein CVU06_00360 [Bacteroidetes bacterium HGW-Bacteroidetes-22]HBZ67420.1 hypothetical protein [Bacteroidales bacterium]
MTEFERNNHVLLGLIDKWMPVFLTLPEEVAENRRNNQNRTIKQILGHLIDSATNNTHRIIHLQYQPNPLIFPDYANLGNNDRWIAIQNYQAEKWADLIHLWKYTHLHLVHVIRNVNHEKLDNEWISALGESVSLKDMIQDYLRHFRLHLDEIAVIIGTNRV